MTLCDSFRFGIEGEYLLVDQQTYRPLWYPDLEFAELNSLLENIQFEAVLDGLSLDGLELDMPHRKLMPFYVEGYGIADPSLNRWINLLPKGIEVRTPICSSIAGCVEVYEGLVSLLQDALGERGYRAVAISHHPTASRFCGPQNHPRHDWWRWAMQAMTTYGPDLNLSLPAKLAERFDAQQMRRRAHYFIPAMVAFSLASPIESGALWHPHGRTGYSLRTHRRTPVAPLIAEHPKEQARLEFKAFDMPADTRDFAAYLSLWLWLATDWRAPGEAEEQDCIYDLGEVARFGWDATQVVERAEEMLDRAHRMLAALDMNPDPLDLLHHRLESRTTPAHKMIEQFESNPSITDLLRTLDPITHTTLVAA